MSDAWDYWNDRTQRSVLFWDVLRQRGNNYLAYYEAGQPPVLVFDYEMVMDGRILEQPVNYALVRILARRCGKKKPEQARILQKAEIRFLETVAQRHPDAPGAQLDKKGVRKRR